MIRFRHRFSFLLPDSLFIIHYPGFFMFRFLSFSFLLFFSFVLEQTVLLFFGLAPGGFFIPFLALCFGFLFLEREEVWWFLIAGGIIAALFSVTPLFSFLLFVCGGALLLFLKRLAPVEGAFSFLAALWFGAASYFAAFAVLWWSGRLFGFFGAFPPVSFRLFFVRAALFALWLFVPASVFWWFAAYWRRNKRHYALR